jgi:iron complex transport system substrate-binding protein
MKKALSIILVLLMILSIAGCADSKPKDTETEPVQEADTKGTGNDTESETEPQVPEVQEITVTDMIGREVTVTPGSYTRVVCIGAGALRMYTYIGSVGLLCGVEDIDNKTLSERPKMFDGTARPYVLAYGSTFETLPSCGVGGPNAQAAEAEKILSCNPDIVISEYEDVDKENALQEQLGIPVITLKAGPNGVFDEPFKNSMRLLGTIFCEEEKAEALVKFVEDQQAELETRTKDVAEEDKPSVYICGLGNWGTTNHLMTSPNFISLRVVNVKNAVADVEGKGVLPIETEKFVAAGETMDIMIIDAAAVKNIKPLYAEDPSMFDTCKAWQNGEVYLEMAYNAYYTNYEIALINTWFIAKAAYPDLFEDIDMTEKTNEITNAFFGMDLAEQIFSAPASFGGYQKIDTATFFN